MPKNLAKFNTNWYAGSTSTTFKCSLCQTNDLECQWKQNSKFTVSTSSSSSTSSPLLVLDINNNKNKALSFEDEILKAEILWALNVSQKGFSYCN